MPSDAFPPFLHLMVPVSPAAMVAMPSKSHVLGSAEAHFGGLVIQAHLADTLLMPACKKRTGIKFASAAPNTVAAMPRMTAITKSPSEVGGATATRFWSLRQLLQSSSQAFCYSAACNLATCHDEMTQASNGQQEDLELREGQHAGKCPAHNYIRRSGCIVMGL